MEMSWHEYSKTYFMEQTIEKEQTTLVLDASWPVRCKWVPEIDTDRVKWKKKLAIFARLDILLKRTHSIVEYFPSFSPVLNASTTDVGRMSFVIIIIICFLLKRKWRVFSFEDDKIGEKWNQSTRKSVTSLFKSVEWRCIVFNDGI